jgi:hypothetical protein
MFRGVRQAMKLEKCANTILLKKKIYNASETTHEEDHANSWLGYGGLV